MKVASVIVMVAILTGLALCILPAPRDRPPPAYHQPQKAKLRNTGKALVVFQDVQKRKVANYDELRQLVHSGGRDYGIVDSDLVFTSPDGATHSWILYPVIDGIEYLVASPVYDWHGEWRQLTYRLVADREESEIIRRNSFNFDVPHQ